MKRGIRGTLIVFTTVSKRADAVRLGRILVKNRVAACISLVPGIASYFWWKGKIVRGDEVLMILKTTRARYKALEKVLKAVHPYEIPEIVGVSIARGYTPYLEWLMREVHD